MELTLKGKLVHACRAIPSNSMCEVEMFVRCQVPGLARCLPECQGAAVGVEPE